MNTSFSVMRLIRFAVAFVFISSGLMKFFNAELAGQFLSLGLPYPDTMLNLVIFLEIGCGTLILFNKCVKTAVIPLIAIMVGALFLTKFPYLNDGLLAFAFYSKLDVVMLTLLVVLYRSYH
ncbi:DoxX family protein [Bacillus sp. BRMEA1]|nr:DoxX family protein [Neobacillus endophyticus]